MRRIIAIKFSRLSRGVIFTILFCLPLFCFSQTANVMGPDTLKEQYLFPISSYQAVGRPQGIKGSECLEFKLYEADDYASCSTLPANTEDADIKKSADSNGALLRQKAKLSFKFNVQEQGDYSFIISAYNDQDNFYNLTQQQIEVILNNLGIELETALETVLTEIGEDLTENDLTLISTEENRLYNLLRHSVYSVYVDGEEVVNKKGFLFTKITDSSKIQQGSIAIGNLVPGDHTIYLYSLSDYYYNFTSVTLPEYVDSFKNADLDGNKILDTNPVINFASIDRITPTEDIIGIRVYTNFDYKDPAAWYQENVLNPSGSLESIVIDGYQGVRDDRTVYVNAANLKETPTATGTVKQFFTNIYVMAYNQGAPPDTTNIFNQMLDNWVFNKNIMTADPLGAEKTKDKLRRDIKRLQDINLLGNLIDGYYANNGKYPTLEAGTFVKDHTISTWPSWQATLGNKLGSALPVDPLNLMATENRGQYDCTNPVEKTNCVNICSRNANGDPLFGCPASGQCVGSDYCSICPSPFDSQTCWDEIASTFNFSTFSDCPIEAKLNGSFNLGGTACTLGQPAPAYDGAYLYQYTALNNGKSYNLNYRLEYQETDVCSPGQCYFDNDDGVLANDCYNPGACLWDTNADGTGENPDYKNTYCYLGNWRKSCGDGFIQSQCGEICDPNVALTEGESWCDQTYGAQDWYNEKNIKPSCSASCELAGLETAPKPYTPDITDLDCGGYCGDQVAERIYGEQCDLGQLARQLPLGIGGISKAVQYWCTGSGTVSTTQKAASDCIEFADDYYDNYQFCSNLPSSRVSVVNTTDILALGGYKINYNFDINTSGSYTLKFKAANYGDNINSLTNEQLDYLFYLATQGQSNLYNLTATGGLIIPEYGEVSSTDPLKYNLLRSQIYSVYLDGEDAANRIGFVIIPAKNESQMQTVSFSLGNVSSGDHVLHLHFVGDHFYLPFGALNVPSALNGFSNVDLGTPADKILDINPLISSLSISSPEMEVGQCRTFGGWCGDGIVDPLNNEECDLKTYRPPLPSQTVNIAKNPSLEKIFSPWEIKNGQVTLDSGSYFEGSGSALIHLEDTAYLRQFTNLFKDKHFKISLRVKTLSGSISSVKFETGDQFLGETWFGNQVELTALSSNNGWQLYQINDFAPVDNGFKFRIIFNATAPVDFYLDDIKITPITDAGRPRYECGNDLASGKICQLKGGYCGDGIKQAAYGEGCDDRVGLACSSNDDCGSTIGLACEEDNDCGLNGLCSSGVCSVGSRGTCSSGTCASANCNDICQSTFCGDGIVQSPNSLGINEICDPGSDPTCAANCVSRKIGGTCSNDSQCAENLSCSVRSFGDTTTYCLGERGSYGCKSNNDCIIGYYCEASTTKCEPEISTYLRYHPELSPPPENEVIRTLPAPSNVGYNIHNSNCPNLSVLSGDQTGKYVLDACTGFNWSGSDNTSRNAWNYNDAKQSACSGATRLPTISELYSLVRQTNTGLFYADKAALRLCPLSCSYDQKEADLCADCPDSNYLYWSGTCSNATSQGCQKALAVNFKYGSIEEYDAGTLLKAHCLKDTVCGNSKLEEGETCEFYTSGNQLVEQQITRQCAEFGYDGGFLHCDPATCTFRMNNCYLNSETSKPCSLVCQERKGLDCESVGLNISKDSDYYDLNAVPPTFIYADDQDVIDIDTATGNCALIPDRAACGYQFINRTANCFDSQTGEYSPFRAEYSYCNCLE